MSGGDLSDPGEFGTTIGIRFQKLGETFRLLRSDIPSWDRADVFNLSMPASSAWI